MVTASVSASQKDRFRRDILYFLYDVRERYHSGAHAYAVGTSLGYSPLAVAYEYEYLEQLGLIRVSWSAGWASAPEGTKWVEAELTARGVQFVEHPEWFERDEALGPTAVYIVNNQSGTIGQLQAGGSSNRQTGNVTIRQFHHPQNLALQASINGLRGAMAQCDDLNENDREVADDHLTTIERELAKPAEQQSRARLEDRMTRLSTMLGSIAALAATVKSLAALLGVGS